MEYIQQGRKHGRTGVVSEWEFGAALLHIGAGGGGGEVRVEHCIYEVGGFY